MEHTMQIPHRKHPFLDLDHTIPYLSDELKLLRRVENDLLLHRESSSPCPISLFLIHILMIGFILSVNLGLSVVEIVGSCHSRQSGGDSRRVCFACGEEPSVGRCFRCNRQGELLCNYFYNKGGRLAVEIFFFTNTVVGKN